MKEKNGYNDYTVEALQYIKLRDNQFLPNREGLYAESIQHTTT